VGEDLFPFSMLTFKTLDFAKLTNENTYWYISVMRKRFALPFAIPFQQYYKPIRKEAMARRYKIVREGQLIEDWPPVQRPSNRYLMAREEDSLLQRLAKCSFPPVVTVDDILPESVPKEREVCIDFGEVIFGKGWGRCLSDTRWGHGRYLSSDGTATLYLRLDERLNYNLKASVWCSPGPNVIDTMVIIMAHGN